MQYTQTQVKERPILFSGEMVRAILEGRKTQTRRLVKPEPTPIDSELLRQGYDWDISTRGNLSVLTAGDQRWDETGIPAKYGKPGDRLYVRETWKTGKILDHVSPRDIELQARDAGYEEGPFGPLWYPADDLYRRWGDDNDFGGPGRTRSPRYMPRWASRILLEITDVRVERLQDISGEDAMAEGIEPDAYLEFREWAESVAPPGSKIEGPRDEFRDLWNGINVKHGYSWESNPWVWVIDFKRIG